MSVHSVTRRTTHVDLSKMRVAGDKIVMLTAYDASFAQVCDVAGIDALLIAARADDVQSLTEFDEGPLPADWIGELEKRGIAVTRDIERDAACEVLRAYGCGGGGKY